MQNERNGIVSVDRTLEAQHAKQRGTTLVEMAISTSLIVAVLGITYTAADVVNSVNKNDQAKLKQEVGYRDVLYRLRQELRHCSTDKDPRTNLPRWEITTDANGRQKLRVQKIIGARLVAGELEPKWSSDIEFWVEPDGRVARREDGRVRHLGGGFKTMYFQVTDKGAFKLTAVTRWKHPKTGQWKDVTHDIEVKPLN